MKNNTFYKIDIILMIVFPVLAAVLALIFKTNYLISTLLFFGMPAFYLAVRKPKLIFKSLVFSAVFSIPLTPIIVHLAVIDKAWLLTDTVFSLRLFGTVPIEDFIFGLLGVFFVVIFYEYFFDSNRKNHSVSKNIKYLAIPVVFLLTIFFVFLFLKLELLHIEYFYLRVGLILALFPLVIFLLFFPKFLRRFVKISIYFFGFYLLFELVALRINLWTFPGNNLIGFVELFGLRFPFEDLLFWLMLSAGATLSFYEFFADDRK